MTLVSPCPLCGKTDQVARVSAIYIEGIQRMRSSKKEPESSNRDGACILPASFQSMSSRELMQLSRRLRPPEFSRLPLIKPIHPDLLLLPFCIIAPLLVHKIYASQPAATLPALVILTVSFALYMWGRKNILASYHHQLNQIQKSEERQHTALQRWMRLYYCGREDCAFEAESELYFPADQLIYQLLQNDEVQQKL